MNILEAINITNPNGEEAECANFIIEIPTNSFLLTDIVIPGQRYMFTAWMKSDSNGSVSIDTTNFEITSTWQKYSTSFVATSKDISLTFGTIGNYYIWHAKLEVGNKPTDWTPAPEDVDGKIDNAQESADSAQNDIDNAKAYTHTVLSVDSGTTLAYFDFSGHMEAGTLTNGANANSTTNVRLSEYIKVISGSSYVWNIKDQDGVSKTPVTHFYTYDSTNDAYTYSSSQSTATITAPTGTDVYLRFTVAITQENMLNSTLELTLSDLDSIIESQTINVYIGMNASLDSYMSINASDYEWELTDTSTIKNATELAEKLHKQLYDETDGDIKLIHDGIADVQKNVDVVVDDVDLYKSYVQINPDAPSITLVTSGDINVPGNKVAITDEKISFYNGAIEGAYIGYVDSEQSERTSMAVSKTYVTEMFPRVEDPNSTVTEPKWIGQLCWIARTNGHLSLKVVK